MHDRVQIIAFCLAQLRKVAAAHPDGLAKTLGVPVATLVPILSTDRRFARVAGPGGWWWKLADALGVQSATTLDELQGQLAAARSEIATLKAEVARLSAAAEPPTLADQVEAGCAAWNASMAANAATPPIVYGSQPGSGWSTATEQLVPGNSRPRERGGWFAATLRRMGGEHTIAEIANADRRDLKAAAAACNDAQHADLIERVGKRGRAFLWRIKGGAA